ncbi:MAG: class I SAM-dependent methyltransferase [Alphaproteobacteria bacterium]
MTAPQAEPRLRYDPACQACGAEACTPALSHAGVELYRCNECGLVFLHPMPCAAEVATFYDDAYEGATTSYFTKVDKKMRRSRGRVRQIRRYVRAGRFLDVGCNGGFVVEAARKQGFDAYGIDPDPVSIAYAREHYPRNTYFTGMMEAYDPGGLRFDAVYCSEVIEHVPDVNAFVAAIANAMAPGAVLYLTTPDISHWRRPRDLTQWDAFCPPSHCLYFSPHNLILLLDRHRFSVIRRRLAFKPGIKLFARKAA